VDYLCIILAVVLASCSTTTSNVRLIHDLRVRGNELVIQECLYVWTVEQDHTKLGGSRDEHLEVGRCSPRSEMFPGGGAP
jgi:hypothetical protein